MPKDPKTQKKKMEGGERRRGKNTIFLILFSNKMLLCISMLTNFDWLSTIAPRFQIKLKLTKDKSFGQCFKLFFGH